MIETKNMGKIKNESVFWNEKARNFPIYDETDTEDMRAIHSIMDIAASRGVSIEHKNIIDIGCGTGRHSLTLAKKARSVTATDVSSAMIDALNSAAQKYSFNNVKTIVGDWRTMDIDKNGWLKSFDIAWAAMTSAINCTASIEKMNSCAVESCVCIAWGRKRENKILAEIFKAHGAEFTIPFSVLDLSGELKKLGIDHSLDFIDNSWESTSLREDAIKDICWHLEINNIKANKDIIEKIITAYYQDASRITHETIIEMGILVWRPL